MIKLIVSDFDGVLLDCKEIHYESLNQAIFHVNPLWVISEEDHVTIYDGLSTKKKLSILSEKFNIADSVRATIFQEKQNRTIDLMNGFAKINSNIKSTIEIIKKENPNCLFYVASNAVRKTIEQGLKILGITNLVDKIFSNEDVKFQKPHSQIYLKCMVDAGVNPDETLIIEDSKHGREAAIRSGARVCGVDNSFDFTLERIRKAMNNGAGSNDVFKVKWSGKSDLNVLIPIGGSGKRFADAGYKLPKPLIDVNGVTMIKKVIDNLNMDANYIFVAAKEHVEQYGFKAYLEALVPGCTVIIEEIRKGAAPGTLLAKELINNDQHLLLANCDQFMEWDSCDFMYHMLSSDADGSVLTFTDSDPKWSFCKLDDDGYITEIAEKRPISNHANVGIYYWKRGSDYVKAAEQMLLDDSKKINGEFYIAPVYNEAIAEGKKFTIFPIKKMWGLGIPSDLSYFLNNYKE